MNSIFNSLANAAKGRNFIVIANKILSRFQENDTSASAKQWAAHHAISVEEYCVSRDSAIWTEASEFAKRLESEGNAKLVSIDFSFGGGGAYDLIYFMVRWLKPATIVETGVAAGWSSKSFLSAIEKNGTGHLYSSDFPYFRLPEPEKFIGILVDERLRDNWTLDIRGDEFSLPDFAEKIPSLSMLHYDSDKSSKGRQRALDLFETKFADDACLIMDDIQDNKFFQDYVTRKGFEFEIVEFGGKYVGIVENIGAQLK